MPAIDITEDVLFELGLTSSSSADAANVPPSIRWDCSIGSLPFLFAFSDQNPYQRETSEFRRQRIDTERNPGEQSLDSGYWIRSQSAWHYGSGLTSAEPLEVNENESRFRYHQGGGVDPWTAGQVTLLHDTENVYASAGSAQLLLGVNTGVLHADGSALSYQPSSGGSAAVSWGGSATIQSLTTDGANYYVGCVDGIYKGALPSGAGSKVWNTGDTTLVRWVKSRLMATVGKAVYELTGTGPALPTALDPGTSRPSGWVWTDMTESPQSIYLSGYVGDTSLIESVGVTATSTTVTLAVPTVVAEMPRGEVVKSLYSYVGRYLIVGTSRGVRVGQINYSASTYDTISLGPLVVESADGSMDAVASGPFVFCTVGSQADAGDRVKRAGLWRIDLGTNLNQNPLQFASAADLVVPAGVAGQATQVTVAGDRLWFAVSGAGVFRESDSFVAEGWMETGRIRLGTVESKAWRDMRILSTDSSVGKISGWASSTDDAAPSSWSKVIEIASGTSDSVGLLNKAFPAAVSNLFAAFRLERAASGDSPVFIGYQVRAIPAPRRSQIVSVPVLCFDFELDRQGTRYGQRNGSYARMEILRLLEKNASTVVWRDYTTGEVSEAYIERISYKRTNPPTRNVGGNGGIATILLRIVS